MNNDPWVNRSDNMKCKACMWFVEKSRSNNVQSLGQSMPRLFGRCRRHCPTMGGFPAVFGDDWCGDHRIDENKLKAE